MHQLSSQLQPLDLAPLRPCDNRLWLTASNTSVCTQLQCKVLVRLQHLLILGVNSTPQASILDYSGGALLPCLILVW